MRIAPSGRGARRSAYSFTHKQTQHNLTFFFVFDSERSETLYRIKSYRMKSLARRARATVTCLTDREALETCTWT